MLSNIIDIDYQSMKVSLDNKQGGLLLFDFEAAFLSISHAFMFKVLQKWGMPTKWLSAIEQLYVDKVYWLTIAGRHYPSL